jgi:hypothetical protein
VSHALRATGIAGKLIRNRPELELRSRRKSVFTVSTEPIRILPKQEVMPPWTCPSETTRDAYVRTGVEEIGFFVPEGWRKCRLLMGGKANEGQEFVEKEAKWRHGSVIKGCHNVRE